MKFQRAQGSIIRSIRQVSLFREWMFLRGAQKLPKISDFTPDSRSGDAADLYINRIISANGGRDFQCQQAGPRIIQAFGCNPQAKLLDDYMDASSAKATRRAWNACADHKLPVYSIVPVADANGIPVTIEHIYMPYSEDGTEATTILSSLHAFSTEGRFALDGLARQSSGKSAFHWSVMIDPQATVIPAAQKNQVDTIELDLV